MDFHREPGFSIPGDSRLLLDVDKDANAAADFLAHAIVRNPSDLRAHVQRIYLHLRTEQRDGILAALTDLFISLGGKGVQLRTRLLAQCRHLLDQTAHQFLHDHLHSGIGALDALPPAPGAMLPKGVSGTARLITTERDSEQGERDYLEEARSFVEYGELDMAKQTLTEGILLHPGDEALHDDLLELFQYTDDREGFQATVSALQAIHNPYPDKWIEDAVLKARGDRQ